MRNNHRVILLFVRILFVVCVFILGIFVATAIGHDEAENKRLIIPTKSSILQAGYPTNQNGETYGPDIAEWNYGPDLILARDKNGNMGYIKQSEEVFLNITTPSEAIHSMSSSESHVINMYLQDGVTVIGQFE